MEFYLLTQDRGRAMGTQSQDDHRHLPQPFRTVSSELPGELLIRSSGQSLVMTETEMCCQTGHFSSSLIHTHLVCGVVTTPPRSLVFDSRRTSPQKMQETGCAVF